MLVGVTIISALISSVLHICEVPPIALKVVLSPLQILGLLEVDRGQFSWQGETSSTKTILVPASSTTTKLKGLPHGIGSLVKVDVVELPLTM